MQVMHYRMANLPYSPLMAADLAFDLGQLSTRSRLRVASWTATVSSFDAALGQQLGKGLQPYVDALGVVRPVNTGQDRARIWFGANRGPAA